MYHSCLRNHDVGVPGNWVGAHKNWEVLQIASTRLHSPPSHFRPGSPPGIVCYSRCTQLLLKCEYPSHIWASQVDRGQIFQVRSANFKKNVDDPSNTQMVKHILEVYSHMNNPRSNLINSWKTKSCRRSKLCWTLDSKLERILKKLSFKY
jgi:hypothetical protein